MEIVRLAGPPGVGKTTVAWMLAQADAAAGVPVAFVDIDQLGICYPARVDDAERWLLKEKALRRLAPAYAMAGAARLIVSGVAPPGAPPPLNDTYPTHSIWLDAVERARRERLAKRGWAEEEVDIVAAQGSEHSARAHEGWRRVDTHARTPRQLVDEIRAVLAMSSGRMSGARSAHSPVQADVARALWLSGPRVVGTSTIGWAVASDAWGAGRRTGFIDVEQLGFVWNVRRAVGASNAGELGRVFAEAGAADLVIVAPLGAGAAEVRGSLGAASFVEVRVAADETARRERIASRREGHGPMLAGDRVYAASDETIEVVISDGAARSATLLGPDEHVLETSRLSVADAAARLRAIARW